MPIGRAFLEGLIDGDGCEFQGKRSGAYGFRLVTISRPLVFGLISLSHRLGINVSAGNPRPNSSVIEGRHVNAQPVYEVNWSRTALKGLKKKNAKIFGRAVFTQEYVYLPVTGIAWEDVSDLPVFNMETTDHTYAIPFIVHNCNWCTIASDWCLDLWRPLDDITLEQALSNINITIGEHNSGFCQTEHLIDDYTLSRNIARFGLKATTLTDIGGQLGWRMPDGRGSSPFLWHKYTISNQQKVEEMLAVLTTPNGDPAFAEKGELIRDAFGNLRMKMPDGRIVNQAGMGLGLMTEAEAAAYKEQWAKKA